MLVGISSSVVIFGIPIIGNLTKHKLYIFILTKICYGQIDR